MTALRKPYTWFRRYICIWIYICMYICIHIFIFIYIRTHMCKHTYTDTYQTRRCPSLRAVISVDGASKAIHVISSRGILVFLGTSFWKWCTAIHIAAISKVSSIFNIHKYIHFFPVVGDFGACGHELLKMKLLKMINCQKSALFSV